MFCKWWSFVFSIILNRACCVKSFSSVWYCGSNNWRFFNRPTNSQSPTLDVASSKPSCVTYFTGRLRDLALLSVIPKLANVGLSNRHPGPKMNKGLCLQQYRPWFVDMGSYHKRLLLLHLIWVVEAKALCQRGEVIGGLLQELEINYPENWMVFALYYAYIFVRSK